MSSAMNGEETWQAEAIVGCRGSREADFQYLVKWEGFGSEENTWEKGKEIEESCEELIFAFELLSTTAAAKRRKKTKEHLKQAKKRKSELKSPPSTPSKVKPKAPPKKTKSQEAAAPPAPKPKPPSLATGGNAQDKPMEKDDGSDKESAISFGGLQSEDDWEGASVGGDESATSSEDEPLYARGVAKRVADTAKVMELAKEKEAKKQAAIKLKQQKEQEMEASRKEQEEEEEAERLEQLANELLARQEHEEKEEELRKQAEATEANNETRKRLLERAGIPPDARTLTGRHKERGMGEVCCVNPESLQFHIPYAVFEIEGGGQYEAIMVNHGARSSWADAERSRRVRCLRLHL